MNKKKIFITIMGLVLALTLLSVGTFAWFTLSTEPLALGIQIGLDKEKDFLEISTDYANEVTHVTKSNANWAKEFTLKGALDFNGLPVIQDGLLRPISTADLEHWYLPVYDPFGNVEGFREVPLSDVANRRNDGGYIGDASYNEDSINYLNYFDIWIRTTDDTGKKYQIRFSNPLSNASGVQTNDFEENFGTYVLWKPSPDTIDDEALSCIRFGFMIYNQETQDTDDESVDKIYIYEPNADMHPTFSEETEAYTSMNELSYIASNTNAQVGQHDDDTTTVRTTMVPKFETDGNGNNTYTMVPQDSSFDGCITQLHSEWNEEELEKHEYDPERLNSKCIKSIGQFCERDGVTIIQPGDLPVLTEVDQNHMQKIRVFVWIEGQDADCWNEITEEAIIANFELISSEVTE